MSDPSNAASALQVIEDLFGDFDRRATSIDPHEVRQALEAARAKLGTLSPEDHEVAARDLLAFSIVAWPLGDSPWGTYYGPTGSAQTTAGEWIHFPDISSISGSTLDSWRDRARKLKHPDLRAHFADLVWDLGSVAMPNTGREVEFGRFAADAHVQAAQSNADLRQAFRHAERALGVAIALSDKTRITAAKTATLTLHKRAVLAGDEVWRAFDIFEAQRKVKLSDAERSTLVKDLEAALVDYANKKDSKRFDPYVVELLSSRLLKVHRREKDIDAERRIHRVVAETHEHHASLASAMLASSVLNDSMEAYLRAGLKADAERIRRLMAERVREANAEMSAFRQERTISFDEVDAFKAAISEGTPERTLARIAVEFLSRKALLSAELEKAKGSSPLLSMVTQQIMSEDRVVATVGSVDDDPQGRLIREAHSTLQWHSVFLIWAFEAANERHQLGPADLARWANRAGLFGDGQFLAEGLAAWAQGDRVKALHVLVPQVERGLRILAGKLGRPTTKPHPTFKGAQVVVTMGDIIYSSDAISALGTGGEDLALHFAALFADPRGMNLRNDLAHGDLGWGDVNDATVDWTIHALLLLGLWLKPGAVP